MISDRTSGTARREALEAGARLFDAGRYWEAHERWEERWRVEGDEVARRTFQSLIQIAAALHKLRERPVPDPAAAARLFERGLTKLEADFLAGFDLRRFRGEVEACAAALATGASAADVVPRLSVP